MAPTIAALNIHPLKAGVITPLQEARIGPYGLLNDRLFMVVDSKSTLISQRDAGKEHIALIVAELTPTELRLSAPSMRPLTLPRDDDSRPLTTVHVHDNLVSALDCGAEASAWLTAFLGEQHGEPVSLAQFDTSGFRQLNTAWYPDDTAGTAFADGAPILVTSMESLDALNARIRANGAQPVPMSRFRPNFVLAGLPEPFAEDRIERVYVPSAQAELTFYKPCERCSVTTIDQDAGARGADKAEPLRTLAQFRRGEMLLGTFPQLPRDMQKKVFFGMGAVPSQSCDLPIAVGAEVEITYRKKS